MKPLTGLSQQAEQQNHERERLEDSEERRHDERWARLQRRRTKVAKKRPAQMNSKRVQGMQTRHNICRLLYPSQAIPRSKRGPSDLRLLLPHRRFPGWVGGKRTGKVVSRRSRRPLVTIRAVTTRTELTNHERIGGIACLPAAR